MATLAREHQDHASWRDYLADQARVVVLMLITTGRHLATRAGVARRC
jgi:protoheme IX farnesyltransferase